VREGSVVINRESNKQHGLFHSHKMAAAAAHDSGGPQFRNRQKDSAPRGACRAQLH
jgi:hypothetical protein